ncbi:hypothetical protein V2J09_004626 [Rumex salicifolius]
MADEVIESDTPCSSLAVEQILRLGTAGALWGLCSAPYDATKLGLTGFARTSSVARSMATFGIQCGFSAGVFSIVCCVPAQLNLKAIKLNVSKFLKIRGFHSYHAYPSPTPRKFPKYRFSNFTSTEIQILNSLANGNFCDVRQLLIQVPQRTQRSPVIAWTSMLSSFLKEELIDEARALFDVIPERNVVTYNAMLSGYVQSGRLTEALRFFVGMQEKNVVSWTSMLHGLMSFGMVEEGKRLFEEMPERNVVTWNSMLAGLTKTRDFEGARHVFDKMPVKNLVSWNSMLVAYVNNCRVDKARALFDVMTDKDVTTWTILISGYCRIADVGEAYKLFKEMPEKNVVCWTAMIAGFTRNNFYERALSLFLEMRRCTYVNPNYQTFVSLAKASAGLGFPQIGMQLHAQLIVNGWECHHYDRPLVDGLIYMYTKLLMMDYAHSIFVTNFNNRTLQSCNFLINGYVHEGKLEEAQYIFDIATSRDKISWTSMVSGYLSVGEVAKACELFHNMPEKDAVAWTAIISGHVQNELFLEAKFFFSQMRNNGFSPLHATYSCLLGAAGATADIDQGRQLHCLLLKSQLCMDLILENAIISMYAKCGEIDKAHDVFSEMNCRDVVSWNSMLMGYSNHGMTDEALELFNTMIKSGATPDSVTFLNLLSACSHAGLLNQGSQLFRTMSEIYGVKPDIQHCVSIINLLGREGKVEEAEQFVLSLQSQQGVAVWGALLGICTLNDMNDEINTMVAKRASDQLLQLDPTNIPAHVVLCKRLVSTGHYEDERMFRKEMRVKGVKKIPGHSWVSYRGKLHSFFSR